MTTTPTLGFRSAIAAASAFFVMLLIGCSAEREAPPSAETPPSPIINGQDVRASRIFAGPGQYPPDGFAAYGIVAFTAGVTSATRARYRAICEGYVAALPSADQLEQINIPIDMQMATVWPVTDPELADQLNVLPGADVAEHCDVIVDRIDLVISRQALADARRASPGSQLDRGPYLLAWSPSSDKGREEVPVLVMDLSNVSNSEQAVDRFIAWVRDIESRPELWASGWGMDRLRLTIREWADRWGPDILRFLGTGAT